MRNSIRRSGGRFAFSALSAVCISTAHCDRVHDAGELGQHAVAGGVYEAPVMLLDETVDYLAMRGQGAERRLFVLPHEAAVAEHVGAEYGGELTFHPPPLASHARKNYRVSLLTRLVVLDYAKVCGAVSPMSDTFDRRGITISHLRTLK